MEMNIAEYNNDSFVRFVLLFVSEFRFIEVVSEDRNVLKFHKHLGRTHENGGRMELHLTINRLAQGSYKTNLFLVVGDEDVGLLTDARTIVGFCKFVIPYVVSNIEGY